MPFAQKKFYTSAEMNSLAMRYRRALGKYPFLLFGLPFMGVIVAGSFVLTPATAIRFEKHDRRVRQMTKDEALNVRRTKKADIREEYFRLSGARDLDNWEQKRVKRLPGEPDGTLD